MATLAAFREQKLTEPNHPVEAGNGCELPAQSHRLEGQSAQRIEQQRRERGVGEGQRKIRRLVAVDVGVQRSRFIKGCRTAQANLAATLSVSTTGASQASGDISRVDIDATLAALAVGSRTSVAHRSHNG